jgi:hypothetical protein
MSVAASHIRPWIDRYVVYRNVQVKKVYKQGLFLQFLGYFGATVTSQHLGCPLNKLSAAYPEGKKVRHRLLTLRRYVQFLTSPFLCCSWWPVSCT